MNGVQTRFKCKLDVKRCKRFVFPPSSLLPRSNALKTKAIRYFQTDRTLTRIVSPPLSEHSLRELSDPGIQVVDTFYHRIEGYHIAGNLLIFASDYQSLKKDSNRLFYIQQDKFRPVNKILKAYDFVKNRNIAQKNIYSLRKGRRSVFVNNQEYPLLCYDNCDPLPAQQDGNTPFEFTLQEVIDLLHQMEVEYKTISERETAYTKEHLFLSSSQKSKIKRILGETAHIIENYRNELRIIAHAHEQENREY